MGVTGKWGHTEKENLPLRQVTWATRGEGEKDLGRGEKGKGPVHLRVLPFNKNSFPSGVFVTKLLGIKSYENMI